MMNCYAPIFAKLIYSSIWDEPDYVCKIWITMLAMKGSDHIVPFDAYGIARAAHKTEAEVIEALKILSKPDKRKLEYQPHEGRRIEKVKDGVGWLILNGQVYEDMAREISHKVYKARWAREKREAQSKTDKFYSKQSRHTVQTTAAQQASDKLIKEGKEVEAQRAVDIDELAREKDRQAREELGQEPPPENGGAE